MAFATTPFPVEIWCMICQLLQVEYNETDTREAHNVTAGIASLSQSCRALQEILQPVLYDNPALLGTVSMERFFQTILTSSRLARSVRSIRYYEGTYEDLLPYIEGYEEPHLGEEASSRYYQRLRELGIDTSYMIGPTRGNLEEMHDWVQLLPLFLPNLSTLDYRLDPRTEGFRYLRYHPYPSQRPIPNLKTIRIRGDMDAVNFSGRTIGSLLDIVPNLECLHLEWIRNFNEVGTWPPEPALVMLKELSVRDGCLESNYFAELLFHAPNLEKLHYHSSRQVREDWDDERLTWTSMIQALTSVKDTLQILDLDFTSEYLQPPNERELEIHGPGSSVNFKDFPNLHTILVTQDTIFADSGSVTDGQTLIRVIPKTLKHLELRHLRGNFVVDVLSFASAVQAGNFQELEAVRLGITEPKSSQAPPLTNCLSFPVSHDSTGGGDCSMVDAEVVKTISDAFAATNVTICIL